MSEIFCPECQESCSVELVKNVKKVGAAIGGTAGAITAYSGALAGGSICSVVPIVGTGIGIITGGLAGILTGMVAGAAVGSEVGEKIDEHIVQRYRCRKCRIEFDI